MAFAQGLPYLTHECNIGPGDRPQEILAIYIAFRRSPRANIALKSQKWRAIRK